MAATIAPTAATATPDPPPGVWVHADSRGIDAAIEAGYSEALSADWRTSSLAARVRAFRGWLIEKAGLMGALAGSVTPSPGQPIELHVDPAVRADAAPERARAAVTLYRSASVLALLTQADGQYRTEPLPQTETSALPAVAVIGIAVAAAAAIGYCAHQAAAVVDRQLARNSKLRELVQADAHTQKLVRAHVEREEEAGEQLPLDEATKRALEEVERRVAALTAQIQPPLSSGLPFTGSGSPDGLSSAGFGFGFALAAAVAVYLLFFHHKTN